MFKISATVLNIMLRVVQTAISVQLLGYQDLVVLDDGTY
jgi:hypothetical protein